MRGETGPDSGHPALGSPPRGRRLLARPGTGASSGRFGQRQKSCAAGSPRTGGCQGGAAGGQGRGGRDPITQPPRPARHPAVLSYVLSSPLPPASLPSARLTWRRGAGRRGRGGGGLRGGSRACSGAGSRAAATAAARSAPRPPLHQSFKLARRCGPPAVAVPPPRRLHPPQAPPFRATFGFFFRGGARRELDLFHTLGDPSRGGSPRSSLTLVLGPLHQGLWSRPWTRCHSDAPSVPGVPTCAPTTTLGLGFLQSSPLGYSGLALTHPSPPPARCFSARLW